MTRWEYGELIADKETDESLWCTYPAKAKTHMGHDVPAAVAEVGGQGWELVALNNWGDSIGYMFKRPLD